VFTEIPAARAAEFDALVSRAFGRPLTPEIYYRTPVTSGRIIRINGAPVVRERIRQGERWAYDNDVQIAVIGAQPPNPSVVEGHWWSPDTLEPSIALDADAARAGHLKIGDHLTLSVLGRDIEVRVAALRTIEPGGFGPNFSFVINPRAVEGAETPNIAIAKASKAQEAAVTHALGVAFPQVNVISVREQLEAATDIFAKISLAIRSAAAVAALAGILVLAGAIAARARERVKEAATLKVLGAARHQILAAYAIEYGAVGLIAGIAGVALGYAAAWPVVVKVFEATWSVDWGGVAALVGAAAGLAALGGLAAATVALARRPAGMLRAVE
jgi:putative ABC transport system permease protein